MNRRAPPKPGERCGSLFRVYMGGSAIIGWYMAMYEPRSMMHLVAKSGDGAVLFWLLLVVGAAAMVDAIINDFLPARYHWRVAVRQRHMILTAMAFCYIAMLYVAFIHLRSSGLLIQFLWNVSTIMAVAFFDAHQRSKDASCAIACS